MPVAYELEPIDELLAKYLDSDKDPKVLKLREAMKGYCEHLKGAG